MVALVVNGCWALAPLWSVWLPSWLFSLFFQGSFGLRMRGIIALWLSWLFQLASPITVVDISLAWSVYELTASACIGVVLGFTVRLALDALHFGGEILGINIGLGLAGVVDPNTGTRENPVSRFLVMGGAVVLLSLDLHLGILELLRQSFSWQPHVDLWMYGPRAGSRMFEEGVRFGLPVVGGATLLYLLFGVLTCCASGSDLSDRLQRHDFRWIIYPLL